MPQQSLPVQFTIVINAAPLVVTSAAPADGQVGVAYSHTFTVSGGIAPYTWLVTGGTLPPGLSLSAGGVLSGTPSVAGNYADVEVTVTDSGS